MLSFPQYIFLSDFPTVILHAFLTSGHSAIVIVIVIVTVIRRYLVSVITFSLPKDFVEILSSLKSCLTSYFLVEIYEAGPSDRGV